MVGDVNRSIYEKSASNQPTPEQGQPKENPSPTTTKPTPNRRRVTRRSREYYAGGDLITIYESEDEAKFEQSPTNIQTPHRRQADNGDPGFVPPVRRRLMLDDKTPPVKETRKPLSLPNRIIVGQPQEEIREVVYTDDRARPQYEYIELTTSDSESSQYLDPDSSDDDGHGDCGLGGYEYCPDNPANYRTIRHQEGDLNKNRPDPSYRGIT